MYKAGYNKQWNAPAFTSDQTCSDIDLTQCLRLTISVWKSGFSVFDPFFQLEHCDKNSLQQLGFVNIKFQGQSGLFSGLDRKNFLFGCPSFIGEFLWQCASSKTDQKGKKPDFQALLTIVPGLWFSPRFKSWSSEYLSRVWVFNIGWAQSNVQSQVQQKVKCTSSYFWPNLHSDVDSVVKGQGWWLFSPRFKSWSSIQSF